MITVYNAQNYAQQWFFDKAFAALKARNKLNDAEKALNRFLSLDGYFAHMNDLISIDASYVLLPSDERPFEINANTRTISIPDDFVKCAGVTGDNMCEIITFTIDRFFDYVDLATASICVQWVTSQGEGISHINLIDLETTPGKIRFGWPLTKELTEKPGPINFSVRFFITNREPGAETDQIVYLLNTLSSTITIREGLNITEPDIEEMEINSLFSQFVQNSANPSYPIPEPVYFNNNPGKNLPSTEKIDEKNDNVTLTAQAVVSDNGHIVYNWYFKERATPTENNYTFVKATEYNKDETYYIYDTTSGTYIETTFENGEELQFNQRDYYIKEILTGVKILDTDPRFSIQEVFKEVVFSGEERERNGSEQYFRKIDGETPEYQLVTSAELPNETLYERFTTLTIVPEDEREGIEGSREVTGLYWVGASNYVGVDRYEVSEPGYDPSQIYAMNHGPEVTSSRCYIPTPGQINITTNLTEDKFLVKNNDGSYTGALTVNLERDLGNPTRTYVWYRSNSNDMSNKTAVKTTSNNTTAAVTDTYTITHSDAIVDEDGNVTTAKVDGRGWYQVEITSALNRRETDNESRICRVLEPIKAPVLQKMEYIEWDKSDTKDEAETRFANPSNWNPRYVRVDGSQENDIVYEMDENVSEYGSILRYRISTDLDNANFDGTGLESDNLAYQWYLVDADREILLNEEVKGPNDYLPMEDKYETSGTKNYIDIRCKENRIEERIIRIYCKVTNTLSNETAVLSLRDYPTTFDLW